MSETSVSTAFSLLTELEERLTNSDRDTDRGTTRETDRNRVRERERERHRERDSDNNLNGSKNHAKSGDLVFSLFCLMSTFLILVNEVAVTIIRIAADVVTYIVIDSTSKKLPWGQGRKQRKRQRRRE